MHMTNKQKIKNNKYDICDIIYEDRDENVDNSDGFNFTNCENIIRKNLPEISNSAYKTFKVTPKHKLLRNKDKDILKRTFITENCKFTKKKIRELSKQFGMNYNLAYEYMVKIFRIEKKDLDDFIYINLEDIKNINDCLNIIVNRYLSDK